MTFKHYERYLLSCPRLFWWRLGLRFCNPWVIFAELHKVRLSHFRRPKSQNWDISVFVPPDNTKPMNFSKVSQLSKTAAAQLTPKCMAGGLSRPGGGWMPRLRVMGRGGPIKGLGRVFFLHFTLYTLFHCHVVKLLESPQHKVADLSILRSRLRSLFGATWSTDRCLELWQDPYDRRWIPERRTVDHPRFASTCLL